MAWSMAVKQIKGMKIRLMNEEDMKKTEVQQYDSGFTIWYKDPNVKGKRWIVDASQFLKTGRIKVAPPYKHPNGDKIFGALIDGDEIVLVIKE